MTTWGTALAVALMSFATSVVIPWLLHGRRLRAIEERGNALLVYSTRARATSIVLTMLPPILFAVLLNAKGAPFGVTISVASLFAVLGSLMILEMFGVRVLVERTRIVRRSPWSRVAVIEWKSIQRIQWVSSMRWFEITGSDGTRIRLATLLDGLGRFATTLMDETQVASIADPQTRELLSTIKNAFRQEHHDALHSE